MIYLDSCILIHAVENEGDVGVRARTALATSTERLAISALVVHEVIVVPLRHADEALLDRYAASFAACDRLELSFDVYVRAAELRATHTGLKTVDALHLATAQLAGCSALWTNDRRLTALSDGFAIDVIGDG